MKAATIIAPREDRFAAARAALLLLLIAASLQASALPSDLDSLVFGSEQIVEGRVVRAAGRELVEVTRTDLGDLRPGQLIEVANLFSHKKPGTGYWGGSRDLLADGDELLVFLEGPPGNLACVKSGRFLIVRGRACRFGIEPSDRYIRSWATPLPRFSAYSPRLAELRSAIATSIDRRAEWRAHMDDARIPLEVRWLLSTLRTRATPRPGPFDEPDAISDAAARQLALLSDAQVAEEAILADPNRGSFFSAIFASPEGQEYLLKRITNLDTPPARRRLLITALMGTNGFRRVSFNYHDWPVVRLGLARLAQLASKVAESDKDSAAEILQALETPLRTAAHDPNRTATVRADLSAAMDILAELYRNVSTPDSVKYWIEQAAEGIDYSEYQQLHSPCGPIITLASPLDLSMYAVTSSHSVMLMSAWRWVLPYVNGKPPVLPPVTAAYLVLEPVAGGSPYVLASAGMIGRAGAGGSSDCVALPPGFPAGRYRLHYRLMSGNAVLSEGHGYETQIPQPGLRVVSSAPPVYRPPRFVWRRAWTNSLATISVGIVLLLLLRHVVRSRRRVRWFRTGHCHQCGYDLRSSGKKCSECGTLVPTQLRVQTLRRGALRLAGYAMIIPVVSLTTIWVRSYVASDIVEYTSLFRADAVYSRRGFAFIQCFATGSDPGWVYDRLPPDELSGQIQSVAASNGESFLGAQWNPATHLLILPFWIPCLLILLTGALLLRQGRRVMVTQHQRSTVQKAYAIVLRVAGYPIRLRLM